MDDFWDYFIEEEFIFPEEGGVTGTRRVACPACGAEYDLKVDVGNAADRYNCSACGADFVVNWTEC